MFKQLVPAALVATLVVPLFASAASCPNLTRTLSFGSRGSDVVQLQQYLISQNLLAADSATGYFGRLTQSAVQQFQCRTMNLCSGSPSANGYGVVGRRTRSAIANTCMIGTPQTSNQTNLNSTLTSNSTIESLLAQIRTLQQQINALQNASATPTTNTSCSPLAPQTQTLSCPSGQNGAITQTRVSSCPGPIWSSWTTTLNTCAVTQAPGTCTPFSPQTQTLSCPSGQTGSITQTRISTCASGATSPMWGGWQVTNNTCVATAPSGPQAMGWDHDLKKKCARTTGVSGDTNYYAVTDQCPADGKQWLIANESEKVPGGSAPGPINRSFLINGLGSPVTLDWSPHTSSLGSNWTVHMKVDQHTYPHPNGKGYFTYFGMMDHENEHGGPLPLPRNLETSHALSFAYWTPGLDDAARMLVGAQFYYGGKAHILEINLALSQWGDAHPDPKAILVRNDWYGDGSAEYVTLDGTQMGLEIPLQSNTQVTIPWGRILDEVIANGWFEAIGTQPNVTQAVYIGTEVKNQAVGDLWHTDFRVSSTTSH